jgi:hypothetical protein
MMFARLMVAGIVLCALFCAPTTAQTTRPVSAMWTESVARVTDVLTNPAADIIPIGLLIPDAAIIQRFGSRENDSPYRLQQQTRSMTVVSVRGYTWPAPTIASDLAADIRDSQSLPESVQKQFQMRDEAEARRANTTAAQWVATTLQPEMGELVAMVVVWPPQGPAIASADDGADPGARQPIFILFKGQPTANESFRITQIAYGDVSAALK